ncbi:hypothetical protein LZ189_11950, partial [Rhodovulum sulfidophilum]|nr:hypothetical protein [Rhodovulum sulfidophilum]
MDPVAETPTVPRIGKPGQPGPPYPAADLPAARLNVKDETADGSAAMPDPQAASKTLPGFRPQKQPDRQHKRCRQRQKQRRGQQVERPLAPIAAQPVR